MQLRGLRRGEQGHDTWDVLHHHAEEYGLDVIPVLHHEPGPIHGLDTEVGHVMSHTPPAHNVYELHRVQRRRDECPIDGLWSHTDTLGSGARYPDTPCAKIQLSRDQQHIHTGRLV